MNPPHEHGPGPAHERAAEDVGSLAEEAAKLFGVLSDWAREQDPAPDAGRTDDGEPARPTSGAAAGQVAAGLAEALRGVNEHVATGDASCRYCPVCQVIHAVRETSPEVRQHLSDAAGSLLHAASGFLAAHGHGGPAGSRATGVEKIDLDDDDGTGDGDPST